MSLTIDKKILIPYINSTIFIREQLIIEKYKNNVDIIIVVDEKNNTDIESLINSIEKFQCNLYKTTISNYKKIYLDLTKHNYKLIIPTLPDFYQFLIFDKILEKKSLTKEFESYNILTPKNFELENIKFPILAKPNIGSGGNGIKKFFNKEDLVNWLKNKPFDYFDYNNNYIFQEFIEGNSSTIVACKYNNNVELVCIYDLNFDKNYPQYFVPTERIYPSKNKKIILEDFWPIFKKYLDNNLKNNCPFIADVIIKNKKIYIVDIAYRFPISPLGCYLLKDYAFNFYEYLINNKNIKKFVKEEKIVQKCFSLKKGKVISFNIPKNKNIKIFKKPDNAIKLPWNEKHVSDRGYLIIESKNIEFEYKKILEEINLNFIEEI